MDVQYIGIRIPNFWKCDHLWILYKNNFKNSFSASEKREAMEKKLRAKLEDELKELREAQLGNPDGILRSGDSSEVLGRKLSEAEEKVNT